MENPFVTKGYAGPDYFCDRVKETQQLVKLATELQLQGWFPLELTGLISLLSKGLSRVFSSTTV